MQRLQDISLGTAQRVASSIEEALHNEAIREAVFEFGEVRMLVTKGRRLSAEELPIESPPDYPDVPSSLNDDADSWLK